MSFANRECAPLLGPVCAHPPKANGRRLLAVLRATMRRGIGMDGKRFDDLSRKLATGVSRRGALKGIAAGLLGALGLRAAADAQVTQA